MHKDKWFGLAYIHTNISSVLSTIGLNVLFDIGRVNEFKLFMMDGEYHYFESMWGKPLDNWSFGVSFFSHWSQEIKDVNWLDRQSCECSSSLTKCQFSIHYLLVQIYEIIFLFFKNVYILMDKVNFMNLTRCEYWRLEKSEWSDWVLKIGA